jgi:predicted RecB family nuclease
MYKIHGQLVFSPSDLNTFWESRFASWMDRLALEHPERCPKPDPDDPLSATLQQRGFAHENATIQEFKRLGKSVVEIARDDRAVEKTLEAIRSGVDVICQAKLVKGQFSGYADFLVKMAVPSQLGDYHYEVWDTKLSNRLKPTYILQLCMYTEMLTDIQGLLPKSMTVVLGSNDHEVLKTSDFLYYYLRVKEDFLAFHNQFDAGSPPDPEKYRSYGKWQTHAASLLAEKDSLFRQHEA